jgi:hypothetical protein
MLRPLQRRRLMAMHPRFSLPMQLLSVCIPSTTRGMHSWRGVFNTVLSRLSVSSTRHVTGAVRLLTPSHILIDADDRTSHHHENGVASTSGFPPSSRHSRRPSGEAFLFKPFQHSIQSDPLLYSYKRTGRLSCTARLVVILMEALVRPFSMLELRTPNETDDLFDVYS